MLPVSKLRKLLQAPVSDVLRFSKRVLWNAVLPVPKISLEKELTGAAPAEAPNFPAALFRGWMTGSRENAERICNHEFDLLGSGPINFGKNIDWQIKTISHESMADKNQSGKNPFILRDKKFPWELSRMQFLPTLAKAYETHNEEKYATEAKNLINDWIVKNPLGTGVNWKVPMEAAIRACNVALAWYFFRETPSWQDKQWKNTLYKSFAEHGMYLHRNLEYGLGYTSNHLLADITGLLFLGILFPEFREARKWKAKALTLLEQEMQNQVHEDGVDYEASIPYHRLACELLGMSALLCKQNSIQLSTAFWSRLEKMFEFVWHYTKPNGLAPQIGDNDDGRFFIFENFYAWERRDHRHLFKLAAVLFPLNRKFDQNEGAQPEKTSQGFEKSGIYVLRKNDFYCIVDAGGNGQNGNGGHAHNDTLSFECSVNGEDFIIDPGSYVYTADPEARRRFRATCMHNTVMIDDEEMNRFHKSALFSMEFDAIPMTHEWRTSDTEDVLHAEHSGYERLSPPFTHHRIFRFNKKDRALEISDEFKTRRTEYETIDEEKNMRTFEWNFHFALNVKLEKKESSVIAEKNGKRMTLTFPPELAAHARIHEGEVSPRYGVKEKAPVFTIRIQNTLEQLRHPKHAPYTFLIQASL